MELIDRNLLEYWGGQKKIPNHLRPVHLKTKQEQNAIKKAALKANKSNKKKLKNNDPERTFDFFNSLQNPQHPHIPHQVDMKKSTFFDGSDTSKKLKKIQFSVENEHLRALVGLNNETPSIPAFISNITQPPIKKQRAADGAFDPMTAQSANESNDDRYLRRKRAKRPKMDAKNDNASPKGLFCEHSLRAENFLALS